MRRGGGSCGGAWGGRGGGRGRGEAGEGAGGRGEGAVYRGSLAGEAAYQEGHEAAGEACVGHRTEACHEDPAEAYREGQAVDDAACADREGAAYAGPEGEGACARGREGGAPVGTNLEAAAEGEGSGGACPRTWEEHGGGNPLQDGRAGAGAGGPQDRGDPRSRDRGASRSSRDGMD